MVSIKGRKPVPSLALLLSTLSTSQGRTIKVQNSCPSTIWPALFTGGTDIPEQETGWEMKSSSEISFEASDEWTAGRIWARTGCTTDEEGRFRCLTGSCGGGGGGNVAW